MKTHTELYQALLDGKKVTNGSHYVFLRPNGFLICSLISNGHQVFECACFVNPEDWEIVEESEVELTPEDLGRKVRHRNGSKSMITMAKLESNDEYFYCCGMHIYHANGRLYKDEEDQKDVVGFIE